jgi:hypothetical protein
MRKREAARCRIIIAQLTKLSRNGWRDAKPCDYLPLEEELRRLVREAKQQEARYADE